MKAPAPDLSGLEIAVFGLGRSGVAAARVALERGARVIATDARLREDLSPAALELERFGARLELGGHPSTVFRDVKLVVVSPGIPDLGILRELTQQGAEVVSELEFGLRFLQVPTVFVGGTNGKSTTTTLVGSILQAEGSRVFVGGNLGTPVCEAMGQHWDALVLEVSSFQLERSPTVKPKASILLNVTEDHLDRYATFDDYAMAKGNAFVNQAPDDVAIVPAGDAVCSKQARRGGGRLVKFGSEPGLDYYLEDGFAVEHSSGFRLSLSDVDLHGVHNHHNLLAALAAARALGATETMVTEGVRRFVPLPHRMQRVRVLDGVAYYDDSKATNVGAAVTAISGLTERKCVVIAGGRDKQGSYAPFVQALASKARAVVLIGEATELIARAVGDVVPVRRAASMDEAVSLAREWSKPGDAVLLSPACSSFDMFTSYAHRGDVFAKAVSMLSAGES